MNKKDLFMEYNWLAREAGFIDENGKPSYDIERERELDRMMHLEGEAGEIARKAIIEISLKNIHIYKAMKEIKELMKKEN